MRCSACVLLLAAAAVAAPTHALTLERGDIVLVLEKTDTVVRVKPGSGAMEVLSPAAPSDALKDIAFTSDGTLLGLTGFHVVRIDPATGARTPLTAPGALGGIGSRMTTTPDGRVFVSRTDRIVRVDRVSGAVTPVSIGGLLPSAFALAFEPATDSLLTCVSNRIVRVHSVTGAQSFVGTTGMSGGGAYDIAVGADGSILVSHEAPNVSRVDPVTGAGALFIPGAPNGVEFAFSLAIEPNGGVVVVGFGLEPGSVLTRSLSSGGPDAMRVFTAPPGDSFARSVAVHNPTPCPADTNADRVVDFLDLNSVLSAYGLPCP